MALVKNLLVSFHIESVDNDKFSFTLLDGSSSFDVTHIFRINYYYVGDYVYYFVVSVFNKELDEFVPFKSLTLSTRYPYSSSYVDGALHLLRLNPYHSWLHDVMSSLHEYISNSFNKK